MNNLKKVGLSALAGSMVAVSANAVDYQYLVKLLMQDKTGQTVTNLVLEMQ